MKKGETKECRALSGASCSTVTEKRGCTVIHDKENASQRGSALLEGVEMGLTKAVGRGTGGWCLSPSRSKKAIVKRRGTGQTVRTGCLMFL